MKGKKAMGWTLSWIWNLLSLTVIILIITGAVIGTINKQNDTKNLRVQLLGKRILYSPECFAYQDTNTKTKIGTIDLQKVSEERLKNCFDANGQEIGVKIDFKGDEFYYNQTNYRDIAPIAFTKKYMKYSDRFFVQVVENNKISFDYMTITVVAKK